MPNPVKPFVGQMVTSAYANDAAGFRQAWQAAKDEYVAMGHTKAEAMDYVQRSFSSYHPLRSVFKTTPTTKDYQRVLREMNDDGRTTVAKNRRRASRDVRVKSSERQRHHVIAGIWKQISGPHPRVQPPATWAVPPFC